MMKKSVRGAAISPTPHSTPKGQGMRLTQGAGNRHTNDTEQAEQRGEGGALRAAGEIRFQKYGE